MHLSYTDQLILSSVRVHPTAADLETLDALIPLIDDWDYLSRTIIERGIGPLFFNKLSLLSNAALIPEVTRTNLQQAYFRTLSRSMVLYDVFRRVADAFTLNHIQVVALKGIHLSEWLYGDIGLRQFSDIDLLVNEEDGVKCQQILHSIGFTQPTNKVTEMLADLTRIVHYPPMLLNDVSVELHINLHRKEMPYNLDAKLLIDNSESLVVNSVGVQVLELHDLLIFLCIHLDKHFSGGNIQFTSFCDIVNLLDIQSAEIDWQKLEIRCRMYNCEDTIYKYIYLASKYFNAPLPKALVHQLTPFLSATDEDLFLHYLNGYKGGGYGTSTHIDNIGKINGMLPKLRYIRLIIFPTKEFMLQNYRINHTSLFWLHYPARHWKGFKGLWRMVFGR